MDAHRRDNRCVCGDNGLMTATEPTAEPRREASEIELSFCVVNTSQRELLLRGLDAIARERRSLPFATEVLVLDNGSRDGSAEAASAHPAVDETIVLHERRGKGLNDSELLRRARGRYALLLNEDSELLAGADAGPARSARRESARCLRRGQVDAPRRRGPGLGMALSDAVHGARRRALPAPADHGPEPR